MNLLALTFIFPLIGFLILATGRNRISEKLATIIGVGVMGLSALTTAVVGIDYLANSSDKTVFTTLWTWFSVGGFAPKIWLGVGRFVLDHDRHHHRRGLFDSSVCQLVYERRDRICPFF